MDDNGRLTENVKSGEEMNRKEKRKRQEQMRKERNSGKKQQKQTMGRDR
jgi:hypothetical protein